MYFDAKYMPLISKDRLKHYDIKKIDIHSLEGTYVTILHFIKMFSLLESSASTQRRKRYQRGSTIAKEAL